MSDITKGPDAVVQNYCKSLPSQVRDLTDLLEDAVRRASENAELVRRLQGEVHRMNGAAMCMGFPFIGTEFSKLESNLEPLAKKANEETFAMLGDTAKSLEAIAQLASYVTPANSTLLREMAGKDVKPQKSANDLSKENLALLRAQRILFADDDVAIRMLMRDILSSLGVEAVAIADSGAELLELAPSFHPTIIITDWYMEPINGLELLKRIRKGATPLAPKSQVIFLTSNRSRDQVEQVVNEGVDHFLAKPFSRGVVERAILQVARHPHKRKPGPAEEPQDAVAYL